MNKWTRAICATALALGAALGAFAQDYPSRPVKLIVGFGAGGATDAIARLYGQKMSELLKQPFIIENRPGAGQLTAIRTLQSAQPDGYTLYLGTGSSLAQGPGMRKDLPYDPLKDFNLVALVATTPGVIIVPAVMPVRTVAELLAYSAAHPGKINYGSAGHGTASHLQVEYFQSLTQTKWTHVPYKSDADVVREIGEDRIQFSISTTQQSMPLIKAGKLRALAVTTSQPLSYMPGVATLRETGVKGLESIEPYTFYGLVAPNGTPAAVVSRLNEAVNQISGMPEIKSRMTESLFAEPATSTPASFRTFMEKEVAKWTQVGKTVKLPD
ncbi:MAG: tripartite tricarboxylate transporter substrate binding protein [Pseudomonadota bacterium]